MLATALALAASVPTRAAADPVAGCAPGWIAQAEPGRDATARLVPRGEGALRWMGLLVYRARLWAPPAGWRSDAEYALEIRYARALRGAQLAERSIVEMQQHTGAGTPAQHAHWREAMQRLFPDVNEGDCLVGHARPGGPADFYLNGRLLGTIDDPAFAPAFFGIWLSESTSQPALRRALLGAAR